MPPSGKGVDENQSSLRQDDAAGVVNELIVKPQVMVQVQCGSQYRRQHLKAECHAVEPEGESPYHSSQQKDGGKGADELCAGGFQPGEPGDDRCQNRQRQYDQRNGQFFSGVLLSHQMPPVLWRQCSSSRRSSQYSHSSVVPLPRKLLGR